MLIIHTNDKNTQLGRLMIQNRKPIYFYSHKLTNVKINHTNTKKELLIIVETLKKPYVRKKYYYIYRP